MFKQSQHLGLLLGLLCGLSACNTTSQNMIDDPRHPYSAMREQSAEQSQNIQQVSHAEAADQAQSEQSPANRTTVKEWSALPAGQKEFLVHPKFSTASYETTFRGQSPVQPVGHQQPQATPQYRIERSAAEPRINLSTNQPIQQAVFGKHRQAVAPRCEHSMPGNCPACQQQQAMPCPPMHGYPMAQPAVPFFPQSYPDEYICDGGDRDTPVHYNLRLRKGLDTEDTIAEFTGSNGSYNVKESNKVCIYAPKFAAVMNVSDPLQNTHVRRASGYRDMNRGYAVAGRLGVDQKQRTDQTNTAAIRSRASGLEGQTETGMVGQSTRHEIAFQNVMVLEKLAAVSLGDYTGARMTTIATAMQVAGNWTREQNPMISARAQGGNEVKATFRAEEIIGVEDRGTPGDLQIVKLADKKAAVPGDVLTFTIRFDNTGDKSIYDIRIVDNLTPRLQLLEQTVECSLDADFIAEDNGEGSQVLTWQLKQPLTGHSGGVITFQVELK